MSFPDSVGFSREWAEAWNAHDIERVLKHFHEDVLFTSPAAAMVMPESEGVMRGKQALRSYWAAALQELPDLNFTVEAVSEGISTIVIHYRNQRGMLVSEVLIFDGSQVVQGHGTYPPGQSNPLGTESVDVCS